jgi:hypothetical protein
MAQVCSGGEREFGRYDFASRGRKYLDREARLWATRTCWRCSCTVCCSDRVTEYCTRNQVSGGLESSGGKTETLSLVLQCFFLDIIVLIVILEDTVVR